MSRWWRAHSEARNDPKLMLLPPDMFRSWFILVCLASENDGQIKSASDAAFALRVNESKAKGTIAFLAGKGLFDPVTGGYFTPHNWAQRQYKSDGSAERVKRFRERQRNDDRNSHRNGDVTLHEPFQKQDQTTETETDTEPEKKKVSSAAQTRARARPMPDDFKLGEADLKFAWERGFDGSRIADEFSRFCDHALAHGRTQVDWQAAWRNWVTSPLQNANGTRNGKSSKHGSIDDQVGRLADFVRSRERQVGDEGSDEFFGRDRASGADVEIIPPKRGH